MNDDKSRKMIEREQYRAKLIQAELNAVKSSKAYQLSKKLGIIKAQIKSDPVGLSKKAAKMLMTNPNKARHMFRSASHGAFIVQGVAEQAAKYQEWILLNEPDEAELDAQRHDALKLKYKPLISIITPVFNPPADVFEELIESVLEQTYTNFELCLGNFGDAPEIDAMIARYARMDKRVKHLSFSKNLGIAGNSNQILEKTKGEFIALLDHDDTLSPDALYENAKMLNDKPYDFIYSDKDKIDEAGNRFDPLFKPHESPEMLLNINYLTHLNVMRTEIVRKIGGWDPVTDGAQDWDLFLRVIDASKHVGFIPKVLYHWRVIATSTAMSIETKPYALENQRKTVNKFLAKHGIPAEARMERTELILEWKPGALDKHPLFMLYFSNLTNTHRVMRRARAVAPDAEFVVLLEGGDGQRVEEIASSTGVEVVSYPAGGQVEAVGKFFSKHKSLKAETAVFMLDSIRLPKGEEWYGRLTGWLGIPQLAAVSGRLVDRHDLIVSSGGIVTPGLEYFPLFNKYPRYYQSYIGNAEWVRNLNVIAPWFCATRVSLLKEYCASAAVDKPDDWSDYFLALSAKYRLVMTPHATASVFDGDTIDARRPIEAPARLKSEKVVSDPFSNPNMSEQDPHRLFDDEPLIGVSDTSAEVHAPVDVYQHDATILADSFDITLDEIAAGSRTVEQTGDPQSVAWFLPSFDAVYAGLANIFHFATFLSAERGLRTTFYILKAGNDASQEHGLVSAAFPEMAKARFVAITPADLSKVKPHDLGIATQWATAFPLAKSKTVGRKYYFIQDNEANFYPKGSVSALVELTYSFGFKAIAGTNGLLDMYRKRYGGDGVVMKSKVDLSAYYPREDRYYTPEKPYKVFFYARPNMPRNAFELGIAGLKRLKQQMGNDVEVITAGAPWDAVAFGVEGMFTNLGKIEYEAVPKLYRSVDAGLMFMFSGHPGVTASELMASGCPVVVNEYDDVTWHELYQHEKTCLVTKPTASEVARNIRRCLEEQDLRCRLIDGGLEKAKSFYDGYDDLLPEVYRQMLD